MKFIIKSVLLLLLGHALVFVAFTTKAEDKVSLLVNIGSKHFNKNDFIVPPKEFNPGVGFEYIINSNYYYTGGIFRNSFDETSLYIASGYKKEIWNTYIGVEAGYISGYNSPDKQPPKSRLLRKNIIIAPYILVDKIKLFYLGDSIAVQARF